MSQNDERVKALLARVEQLKLEIAHKDDVLKSKECSLESGKTTAVVETPKQAAAPPSAAQGTASSPNAKTSVSPQEDILAVLKEIAAMANVEVKPAKVEKAGEVTSEDFQALRKIATDTSLRLEQEARKVVLGWKPSRKDSEAQEQLLRSLIQPLETVVASLMAAASLSKMTQILSSACALKAVEICSSCISLVEGLDTDKAPPLCGMVESVCENIRKLPVSNEASVKRQLLEAARAVGDSAREFTDLKESGRIDWGFQDDDDDDEDPEEDENEEDEDKIEEDDLARLHAACNSLVLCKSLLVHIGKSLQDDVFILERISSKVKDVVESSTNFGVELYPPHDEPRVSQKAVLFLKAVTSLDEAFCESSGQSAPQMHELKSLLSSFMN